MSDALEGDFKAIADGGSINGLALRWDRTPVLWGSGPIGLPPIPDALASTKFFAVAIGLNDGVFIRLDGTLTGLLNAPSGGPFFAVDARLLYSLALHADGTLYGWGHPGQGTNVLAGWTATTEDPRIFFIPGETIKAIAAGRGFSIGLSTDGTLWGWGTPVKSPFAAQPWTFDSLGWISPGDTGQYYFPDERFKSIAAAAFHFSGITAGREPVR